MRLSFIVPGYERNDAVRGRGVVPLHLQRLEHVLVDVRKSVAHALGDVDVWHELRLASVIGGVRHRHDAGVCRVGLGGVGTMFATVCWRLANAHV